MSRAFTVDLSDYYGQPDFREQNSSTIVDRRKTLNLHKKLETGKATEAGRTRVAKRQPRRRKAIGGGNGGTGGIALQSVPGEGGAIAFNSANPANPPRVERLHSMSNS